MQSSIIDDIDTSSTGNAKIKVIGVGGGGGNAVQKMISSNLIGVQFISANTDMQALNKNNSPVKIQLGEKLTKGLGAGADPNKGREAANESQSAIKEAIGDADMIFVTAGMGKGTGTGAAPVIAQIAKEQGALTVGVVTKPFSFEGPKRQRAAEEGLEEFKKYVDCLIIIPNDRLMNMMPKKTPFPVMLEKANEVLYQAVRGISDVILRPGIMNVDFADVRTTMSEVGLALMGTGRASGENRAEEAAKQAIMSPLLENVSLESAKAILYNITASEEITGDEVLEIGNIINQAAQVGEDANNDTNIIYGMVFDDNMGDELQVTVIATGIEARAPMEDFEEVASAGQAKVTPFGEGPKVVNLEASKGQVLRPQPRSAPDNMEGIYGGHKTPAAPGVYSERYGLSPYGRNRELLGQRKVHVPGKDDFSYSEEELDIPSFIRLQAD